MYPPMPMGGPMGAPGMVPPGMPQPNMPSMPPATQPTGADAKAESKPQKPAAMPALDELEPKDTKKNVDSLSDRMNELAVEDKKEDDSQGNRPRRHGNRGPRRTSGANTRLNEEILNSEFDFESANAKFKKEKLAQLLKVGGAGDEENAAVAADDEEDEVHIPPPNDEAFYDKASDKCNSLIHLA